MGASATDADTPNVLAKELLLGSSAAYLDRVRELAHSIWLSAGQECGRSLDFWLDAERRVLGSMTATTGFSAPSPSKELPAPKSPQPRKQAAKAKPARARKPAN
jgi:hypothetical protein